MLSFCCCKIAKLRFVVVRPIKETDSSNPSRTNRRKGSTTSTNTQPTASALACQSEVDYKTTQFQTVSFLRKEAQYVLQQQQICIIVNKPTVVVVVECRVLAESAFTFSTMSQKRGDDGPKGRGGRDEKNRNFRFIFCENES